MNVNRVARFDFACGRIDEGSRLRDDLRTPQAGAIVPARMARTGIQLYPQADGTTLREYRPASSVFDPSSIASWKTATVTLGHPDSMVAPSNWRDLAVGHVIDPREDSGKYVAADIVLQDAEALRRANLASDDPDALVEISAGYECDLDMTPGTSPEGEIYDAQQKNIVINHVAIGPRGWARGGPALKLKLDGTTSIEGDTRPIAAMSDWLRERLVVLMATKDFPSSFLDRLDDQELVSFVFDRARENLTRALKELGVSDALHGKSYEYLSARLDAERRHDKRFSN